MAITSEENGLTKRLKPNLFKPKISMFMFQWKFQPNTTF